MTVCMPVFATLWMLLVEKVASVGTFFGRLQGSVDRDVRYSCRVGGWHVLSAKGLWL